MTPCVLRLLGCFIVVTRFNVGGYPTAHDLEQTPGSALALPIQFSTRLARGT
jgi:hypothetical protein